MNARTLKAALQDERSLRDRPGKGAKRINLPINEKSFPTLVRALTDKKTTIFERAMQELEAMLTGINDTLSRLDGEAAAVVPSAAEVASHP